MRNKLFVLITLQLLLPLLLTSTVFADQTQTISIYSPDYNDKVFAYIFSPSYLSVYSTQTYQSEYIAHIQRQNIVFPNNLPGKDLFMFQDINENKTYPPNDPSLFIPNLPIFDYKQMTLVTTVTKGLSFDIQKIDDNNFVVSITSTDKAINFNKYEEQYLEEELIGQPNSYSSQIQEAPSSCDQYFCGTVSAQFKSVESGNYDIEINYGPETIAYIKSAISIIRPYLTPITQNATPSNLPAIPTIVTQPKIQSTVSPTATPTKDQIISINTKHEYPQLKKQKISLLQIIFKYLENILYEIRSKI